MVRQESTPVATADMQTSRRQQNLHLKLSYETKLLEHHKGMLPYTQTHAGTCACARGLRATFVLSGPWWLFSVLLLLLLQGGQPA
jgi:hypothetical protein